MLAAFCGSPDGLSFSKTSVPVEVAGGVKFNVTVNGTKFGVIQSPCAVAGATAISFPFPSSRRTGKLASKYQPPRASPVTVRGLVTVSPEEGLVTVISAFMTLDEDEDEEEALSSVEEKEQPAKSKSTDARAVRLRRVIEKSWKSRSIVFYAETTRKYQGI